LPRIICGEKLNGGSLKIAYAHTAISLIAMDEAEKPAQ
jgi:hypothetical protein